MKKNNLHDRGFSILLVLGGIGILGVLTLLILHQWNRSKANQLYTNGAYQATSIINNLAALVKDDTRTTLIQDTSAWQHTIYNDVRFTCLRYSGSDCSAYAGTPAPSGLPPIPNGYSMSPTGSFAIYNRTNGPVLKFFYDSTDVHSGFNMAGVQCTGYDDTVGNDACPFHAVLYWVANCGASIPCDSYTVYGYLRYKAKTDLFKHPFNPANYSFAISKNSAGNVYFCCSIGCNHLTGDPGPGKAYVTVSVFSAANCFVGSSEIANDFCDRAIPTYPFANNWVYNLEHSTTAGACPQGAP